MAILLADRAVREVLVTLQTYLAAALTSVATDANDGIDVPFPDRWTDYERAVPLADVCECSVWATGVDVLDAGTVLAPGEKIITSRTAIVIRVAHINRDQQQTTGMTARTRHYGAAIARVLAKYPQLMSGEGTIVVTQETSYGSLGWTEVETARSADTVEVRCSVQLTENSVAEADLPAGQRLPAYVYTI